MSKLSKVIFIGFALVLAISAFAKNKRYDLQLGQTVKAGATQLKAGTYQVELEDHTLSFYQGKKEIAKVPVRSEEAQKKIEATSVTVTQEQLKSIELGGTKTRLIIEGQ